MKKRSHPYSHYLKELRPVWKKSPEQVRPMIKDMVEKKDKLFFRPDLMEFVERFLNLHNEKIKSGRLYEFSELGLWVTRQKIQYITEARLILMKLDYDHKYWINKEFQLAYIDQKIKSITRLYQKKNDKGKYQSSKVKILNQLKQGKFPDTLKYDPYWIGKVMSLIQFVDFLKNEKGNLLQTNSFTVAKVHFEINNDNENSDNNIQVQIPPNIFKSINKESTEKQPSSFELQQSQIVSEPKFYTRSEVCEMMQISLPTLDDLTKKGAINCYRIGDTSIKRYRWEDIQAALEKIETRILRNRNRKLSQ